MAGGGYPTTAGDLNGVNASAGVEIIPGKPGTIPSLSAVVLSAAGACQVTLLGGSGEVIFPTVYFPAAGTIVLPAMQPRSFVPESSGSGVIVKANNTAAISAAVQVFQIPAPQNY